MNKVRVDIWGRDFDLPVIYQVFPGEEITDKQKAALLDVHRVDYYEAQEEIRNYIHEYFAYELGGQSLDNLFRYVMPKSIYIPKYPDTGRFAIMCDFKYDMEHGIAIVFEQGRLLMASAQDWVL